MLDKALMGLKFRSDGKIFFNTENTWEVATHLP